MHYLARLAGLLLAMSSGNVTATPAAIEPGVSEDLARLRAALLSNVHYALTFNIPADAAAPIDATVTLSFDLADPSQGLVLDFRDATERLRLMTINGAGADIRHEQEHILLDPASLVAGRNRVQLELTAGDSALNRNPDYLYTLFVPDRARTVFPLFDQPDLKARWELTLILPADWKAVSNAPLQARQMRGDRQELRFQPSETISSYLFAFAAGNFQTLEKTVNGRPMTLYHRETDLQKVTRNVAAIFDLHGAALSWLQDYTGIDYPFSKFDFVLLPDFQYSGMEHPGAVFYRASKLLLDPTPASPDLLDRARLIAHETAHMWFGNLVTMRWFDDVWTKEVFANFMADKVVNPEFPDLNHDLSFQLKHYPRAYAMDRSEGANAIRQPLANLDQAGQLYGWIIYHKAPIMLRQLEQVLGETAFRAGVREYLQVFSHANATWPQLVSILDKGTDTDLLRWSQTWVETPGRPEFRLDGPTAGGAAPAVLRMIDPAGLDRTWPQQFALLPAPYAASQLHTVFAGQRSTPYPADLAADVLFNADGLGYGLFPASDTALAQWSQLSLTARGSLLINRYENLLEGRPGSADEYLASLLAVIGTEREQLLLDQSLQQLTQVFWRLLDSETRAARAPVIERSIRDLIGDAEDSARKRLLFKHYTAIASTGEALGELYAIWAGKKAVPGLPLEEKDLMELAQRLAIGLPEQADQIVEDQRKRTANPDNLRKFDFISPALSAEPQRRDAFFEALADAAQRRNEPWVEEALYLLHSPLRTDYSVRYLPRSLALLQEIQVTGDIFFPTQWLRGSLSYHHSPEAARQVRKFLEERPDYNPQLRMKILQEADPLFRACRIRHGGGC